MVMDNAKSTGSQPKSRKTCCVKKTAKTQIEKTRLLQMKGKTNGDVGKEAKQEEELTGQLVWMRLLCHRHRHRHCGKRWDGLCFDDNSAGSGLVWDFAVSCDQSGANIDFWHPIGALTWGHTRGSPI